MGVCVVCVEVLWPSQPNGVMLSMVSLANHTFTGQAYSLSSSPVLCTFFCQKLTMPVLNQENPGQEIS